MPSLVTRNPCLILAGVLAGLALTAPAAHAATFTVTKTADTVDGTCGADCSLREAVIAANAAAGADVVQVPTGTFALALPGAEDAAQIGDLDVLAAGGALRVQGAGAAQTTIDAD
jgi:CSLREA domain-containing protein